MNPTRPMPYVYVAGPYSQGDVCANIRAAVEAADQLVALGCIPFVPHLSHLWHMIKPRTYQWWLWFDRQWLEACDCVVRIPGESNGADKEVAYARELGIPVYDGLDEFAACLESLLDRLAGDDEQ
jgi:hypothetical protein